MGKQSSDEVSSLAASILRLRPQEGRGRNFIPEDENKLFVPVEDYNRLLKKAQRVAGSVMAQDETPGNRVSRALKTLIKG